MVKVGLVLGAGGAVGRGYHSGTLAGLAEATGWDPRDADVVIGTSAGSGVGALLRAGLPACDLAAHAQGEPISSETARRLASAGRRLPPPPPEPLLPRPSPGHLLAPAAPGLLGLAALAPGRVPPGVLMAAALPPGACSTSVIGDVVRPLYTEPWPARDLWICAVRLDRGDRVTFGRSPAPHLDVATAVEASSAAPMYYAPVAVDDVRYVDGSVHSHTNLDLAADLDLDLVIVIAPLSAAPSALLASPTGWLRSLSSLALAREAATVRAGGTPVVLFEPTVADLAAMGPNPMDTSRRAPTTRVAREEALRRVPDPFLRQDLALLRP